MNRREKKGEKTWDPFWEADKMKGRTTRMFWEDGGAREPLSDVTETEDEIKISIEIPGVKKEDIQLDITEDSVEVKAESKHEEKEIGENFRRLERRYSGFYRMIPLPVPVETDKAKAKYENGILEITLPKKAEARKKKSQIEIQ